MSERFEFKDGSYYEFERPEPAAIYRMKGYLTTMYMNLVEREPDGYERVKSLEIVRFVPLMEETFRAKYDTNWRISKRHFKRNYKPSETNQEVIGVGLTYSLRQDSEFDHGIYLPVKFHMQLDGCLFIDVDTIVSKVLYEPALARPSILKLLEAKTI